MTRFVHLVSAAAAAALLSGCATVAPTTDGCSADPAGPGCPSSSPAPTAAADGPESTPSAAADLTAFSGERVFQRIFESANRHYYKSVAEAKADTCAYWLGSPPYADESDEARAAYLAGMAHEFAMTEDAVRTALDGACGQR